MLPGFLESAYKRYKNDTSIFIKWLCENGSKCGYVIGTAEDETPAKATRLKGKARKKAKEASNGPLPLKPAQSEHQMVSLKELLPLAKAVVNSKEPLIEIPSEIMRAGIRAVSARKRCAGYFKSKSNPGDTKATQANRGHSYFISLMEEVIMALQPCFGLSAGSNSGKKEPDILNYTIEDLENRFATLEVEDTTEQSDIVQPTNPGPSKPIYQVEPPKDKDSVEAEKFFALFCLFDDLQNLRGFLEKLWIEYGAGHVGLITASVTTNAAFQLALRTQEEMLAAYPECGDYQSVLSTLMAVFSKGTGKADEIEIDDSIVMWMFAPAHQLLDSFCDVIIPNQVPLMKRGHFGVYNPRLDRSKLSDAQRQNQDLILLVELLPEFCFIQRYKAPQFATDELTRGLIKMVETKKIPIWLTFATTVLLDIHHTLKDKVDIAFNQLQEVGNHAAQTFSRYFEFSRNIPRPSTWPKKNDDILREFSKGLEECILKDMIFPLKQKAYKKFGNVQPDDSERFYLYKRHPILCGILAFRTVLETQHVGVNLCNAWGTIMYPAHFYNALRQKTNPVQPWPLMDQVIAIHTEERLFLGAAPKSIVDSFKQVSLILGYSASQFASNRRDHKPAVSKNGPRGLKETSVLGELFREGLASDGRIAFTLHNVEALLTEQSLASKQENSAPTLNTFTKTHRLTSIQLLSALSTTIPLELQKLKFDYFTLHEQSISLLRRLKEELDPELKKYFGPMYLENESQLPFVGLYVVIVACGSSKTAESLGMSGENVESKLLEKAGGIFDDFVKELGVDG